MRTELKDPAIRDGTYHLAFPVYKKLPERCCAVLVDDNHQWPHIKAGEYVVVDRSDREFVNGELYLVEFTSCHKVMQVVDRNEPKDRAGIWFRSMNAPRSAEEASRWLLENRPLYTAEGPLRPECLPEKLLGRVIGIYVRSRS